MKFLETLEQTLKQDSRFVGEDGRLLKPKIYDACMSMDRLLLEMLISNEALKPHFFVEVDGTLIFDKTKFAWVLESREFLPDSYTMFKNKIGLADSKGNLISQQGDVTLVWPYKDCVLEGGQTKEDQKRDEIFYNETLAPDEVSRLLYPKVFTNAKRYSANGIEEIAEIGDADNLIIKGNNLLVLASLVKRYEGKVKCVYADIPYFFSSNRDMDTFNYNSNFKRSTWLTFLKDRIEQCVSLLRSDGFLFIHSNDESQGYLKVLCDDVLGESNFVNTIAVNVKNIAGASGGGEDKRFKKNIEYIHIYAKDYGQSIGFNNLYTYTEIYDLIERYKQDGVSWKYTSMLYVPGDKVYIGSTEDGNGQEIKIYGRKGAQIRSISSIAKEKGLPEKDVYYKYIGQIFQTAMPQSSIRPRVKSKVRELGCNYDLYSIEYTPRSGRYKGQLYEQFYKGGDSFRLFAWLKDVTEMDANGIIKKKDLVGTYWDYASETKNLSKEGNVTLNNGKKPERLIRDIILCSTEPGDIVLDAFLGSGTTSAVSLKMNRKFIGLEQLDNQMELTITRMSNVIKGEGSGISQEVNWQGGGSFVYCELMEQNESIASALQVANTSKEVQAILNRVIGDGLIIPSVLPDDLRAHMDEFAQMPLEQQKKLVVELLDKNKLYVNLCDMEDEELAVSDRDKAFTKSFYRMEKEGGM